MSILSALIQTLIQLFVFLLLPFIGWYFTKKENESFGQWIGFKKPSINNKKKFILVLIIILIIIPLVHLIILPGFLENSDLSSFQFKDSKTTMIIPILLYSFIQIGLAEEIFFRGFLLKRMLVILEFRVANLIQAVIFGLVHGLIFYGVAGLEGAVIITLIITVDGWFMGYLNEKLASGSIVPSWIVHGLSNFAVSLMSAFNILL